MKLGWDIRARVVTVALIPTLVLGILLTASMTFSRIRDLDESLTQRGQALARQLASAAEYGLFSGNRVVLERLAVSALISSDLQGVAIFDRDGVPLAVAGLQANASAARPAQAKVEQISDAMLRIAEPVRYPHSLDEDPYTLTSSTEARDEQLGEIVVLVSRAPLENRKLSQMATATMTLLLVLAGSLLLALWMSRAVTRPIRNIAKAMTDIGMGNLAARVPTEGGETLRTLAEGVNDMAERLTLARQNLEQRIAAATVQLRERTEEAERANLAKSRFLAAASHDLRQPMHALGLFVAELHGKDHKPDDRQLIDRITASAEAMENLLDSLLDISKLDAGVVIANPRNFALAPLFERIANDYRQSAAERGLRFKVRPTDQWVRSDPVLFERILINLVSNALRYTPHGTVMVGARRRGEHILIEVRDSGIGIPPEEQASVFQEFVQLGNSARDRSKGLGLGLAIVRRLADLLFHPITLKSAAGKGSAFGIMVPRAKPESHVVVEEEFQQEFTGKVVAMVDDDKLAQESLAGLLRAWGCFVVAAEGPALLLRSLEELEVQPDIVISDFRLPGDADGLEVIAMMRARFGPQVPALLLSGDTGPETLRKATERGVPLLHKPVRPARLRASLARMLSGRQAGPS